MGSDPLVSLASRLGVPASRLAGLADLTAADLAVLESLVADAFAAEDRAVREGLERTVGAVPRPLRGRARSLLFPGGAA
jgi:hypothetical protein